MKIVATRSDTLPAIVFSASLQYATMARTRNPSTIPNLAKCPKDFQLYAIKNMMAKANARPPSQSKSWSMKVRQLLPSGLTCTTVSAVSIFSVGIVLCSIRSIICPRGVFMDCILMPSLLFASRTYRPPHAMKRRPNGDPVHCIVLT